MGDKEHQGKVYLQKYLQNGAGILLKGLPESLDDYGITDVTYKGQSVSNSLRALSLLIRNLADNEPAVIAPPPKPIGFLEKLASIVGNGPVKPAENSIAAKTDFIKDFKKLSGKPWEIRSVIDVIRDGNMYLEEILVNNIAKIEANSYGMLQKAITGFFSVVDPTPQYHREELSERQQEISAAIQEYFIEFLACKAGPRHESLNTLRKQSAESSTAVRR